jgi:hypothetical protein
LSDYFFFYPYLDTFLLILPQHRSDDHDGHEAVPTKYDQQKQNISTGDHSIRFRLCKRVRKTRSFIAFLSEHYEKNP